MNLLINFKNITNTYTYNLNLTVTDYYPNNVELSKQLNVYILGTGFLYYSNIQCKFDFLDGTYIIVPAVFLSFEKVYCVNPVYATVKTAKIYLSLNGYDFYTAETGLSFYYRAPEIISSLSLNVIPIDKASNITVVTNGYFNSSSTYSYCILRDNENPLLTTVTYKIKTQPDSSDKNKFYCQIPNAKYINSYLALNGGQLFLNVASNDVNYYSYSSNPFIIKFYVPPVFNTINKRLLPLNTQHSFSITGTNFDSTIDLWVYLSCSYYNNVATDLLNIVAKTINVKAAITSSTHLDVNDVPITDCFPNTKISIKITHDNQNFYNLDNIVYSYSPILITKVSPSIILKSITQAIYLHLSYIIPNLSAVDSSLLCVLTDGSVNQDIPATIIEPQVIFCNITAITFSSSTISIRIKVNKFDITSNLKVIPVINSASVSATSVSNGYNYIQDSISLTGSLIQSSYTYYIKIGNIVYKSASVTGTTINFNRNLQLDVGLHDVYISNNLIDWVQTSIQYQTLGFCQSGLSCINSFNVGTMKSTAVTCPPGFSCESGYEVPCPIGYYSPGGSSTCIECPIGSVCNTQGMSSRGLCPNGYLCSTGIY